MFDAEHPRKSGSNLYDDKLNSTYYNIENSAGFSSAQKLAEATGVDIAYVRKWLSKQNTYTLHKSVKRKFTRSRYIVSNCRISFEADLMDVQSISRVNKGVKHLLLVIDIFSREAWCEPLKSKNGKDVKAALSKILQRSGSCLKFRVDSGKEFDNSNVRDLLSSKGIRFIKTRDTTIKCSMAERLIRTLRMKLEKYFTFTGKKIYINKLQSLIKAYNVTKHSAIGVAPIDVKNDILKVWNHLYSGIGRYKKLNLSSSNKAKFKVGEHVRITQAKSLFTKGSNHNWTFEIFKIRKVVNKEPTIYYLSDAQDEKIRGVFYEKDLQVVLVDGETTYKIEYILHTRGKGVNKRLFVKWKGWPSKFNSYVYERDLA